MAIDAKEVLLVSIEQIKEKDLENWKEYLNHIEAENLAMATIEAEKIAFGEHFGKFTGETTIRIICTKQWFVDNLETLREHDEEGMLSVHRACSELEDLYYED